MASARNLTGRSFWPLAPALLLLALVFILPVTQLLWLSGQGGDGQASFEHYARLGESALYLQVLANTFKIATWTTAACLIAGYPVAYLLATSRSSTRSLLLICVLMPFWTSVLVRAFAFMVILGRRGMINQGLEAMGLPPLELIYNFGSVIVGMAHALMPLAVLTMLSVMQNIEPNTSRAASTLGARGAHVFWRIYFPQSLPGVAAAGLLVFITALGFFVTPTLLGSRRETMIAQIIISQIDEALDWGFAGAVAVLLLSASVIVFWLFDRMLGMSVLTGEVGGAQAAGRRSLARHAATAGRKVLAVVSWACAFVGDVLDRLIPPRNGPPGPARRPLLWLVGLTVILFLAAPSFVLIPISFSGSTFFEWPPRGFSLQWYKAYLESPVWQGATWRSIAVGLATAILSVALGTPAAFVLARRSLPGKTAVMAFLLLPMVMPHIIVALALYYAFSRIGLVGTSLGLVLGHTVFSLPYVVITVMAVLRNYDVRLDQAAWTLGASKFTTFRRITYPIIRAGMMTAFLFAFVKSFDELTVALFISSGVSTTLPRQMWTDALLNVSPILAAVSTVMLGFVVLVILIGELLGRRRKTI
ncbi:ABC-type spermidine/putrescine transport system, permease component I [Hyphomicrobiales bacterium]|nr:ABC-type spermidine/putrescine transport system, permease component I [Hyphomicrobiales bacterium]CAH1698345.1 ABC-type spermidine/putrescine transport system, permease component I [Hyphomicrobiales bacterium]CAI0342001.1 putative spermidine/putrescine transport system permease protein [Hyphomicrobiales bacterium]